MKKMFLLFSHSLTSNQIADAQDSLGVQEFVTLPQELQALWSNIPSDLETLSEYLAALKSYLRSSVERDDYILIQGDFGGVYEMVNFSKALGAIPVHSTTKREVDECMIHNKVKKTSTFEHVIYRRY
mgnify:CR=1 FL=1